MPATRSKENADRGDCCCCCGIEAAPDWFDIGDGCCCRIGEWVGDNGFWAFNGWLGGGGKNGYKLSFVPPPMLFLFMVLLLPPLLLPKLIIGMRFLVAVLWPAVRPLLTARICCWKRWYSLFVLFPGRYVADDGISVDESLRPFAGCHSPVAVTFVHGHWLA